MDLSLADPAYEKTVLCSDVYRPQIDRRFKGCKDGRREEVCTKGASCEPLGTNWVKLEKPPQEKFVHYGATAPPEVLQAEQEPAAVPGAEKPVAVPGAEFVHDVGCHLRSGKQTVREKATYQRGISLDKKKTPIGPRVISNRRFSKARKRHKKGTGGGSKAARSRMAFVDRVIFGT